MIKIAVFGNCHQAEKNTQINQVFVMLKKIGAEIAIDADFLRFLMKETGIVPSYSHIITNNDFDADIALSIGGDGTFLRTAERVEDKKIPILGINTGRLGFLADVPAHDIENALQEISTNNYRVEKRSLLEVKILGKTDDYKHFALNEAALLKRDNSSMITIHVTINEQYLNSYEADGLIIATPTGSTGYSLSVGGPILEPLTNNFVLSPVAAHSLTTRPLVITDNCELQIEVDSRTKGYQIALDGKSYNLTTANRIQIKKAPFSILVVKRPGHTFYETLRDKLMWGADKRI